MCGAFGFVNNNNWRTRFLLDNDLDFQPYWNMRPSLDAVIITRNSPNKAVIKKFGIKAPWNDKQLLINAMSETVAEKKTFAKLFREQRCLVPASFYFEWKKLKDGKQPYCIKVKDTDMFAIAGLYTNEGFIILTTEPNEVQAPIHNRMPCILKAEDEDTWLNPDTVEEHLLKTLKPFPSERMEVFPVSSLVNSPKNNFPEILTPIRE